LRARDEREAAVRRVLGEHQGRAPLSIVTLSLNIPGPDKNLAGCETLFARAAAALQRALDGALVPGGGVSDLVNVLGPFGIWHLGLDPRAAKRAALAVEHGATEGRLLDVDVYDASGRQVDRGSLDLAPRACLVCPEPAHECARLGRHGSGQVVAAARALLADAFLDALADALVGGAREELALTPKPGLVDRADSGSHPDLTFEAMSRSIDLLPSYFAELRPLAVAGDPPRPASNPAVAGSSPVSAGARPRAAATGLPEIRACVAAGVRAERRMWDEVGSNAHRGYIFLGGLALLAGAPGPPRNTREFRARIVALAEDILAANREAAERSHGGELRRVHGVAGIHGEALAGLPAVFEHGRPSLRNASLAGLDRRASAHYAMAVLMQHLEDTTAVHRCGLDGLQRLRDDGRRIQVAIESGSDHHRLLAALNDEYRAMHLTMGGVADCLALSLALEGSGVVLPDDVPA
jgi:triphosphoribosyl-dephospho-CoA synthase